MRRSWDEDETTEDLDEPVTITGRQLRSLKRQARVGFFGVLLAFVAIGLATWNLLSTMRGSANSDVNSMPATAEPTDSSSMTSPTPGAPTASAGAPTGAPASAPQAVQPPVPVPETQTPAAPAAQSATAVKHTSTARYASSSKAAAVRRGRAATAKIAASEATKPTPPSGRQPERGVPLEMPNPTLTPATPTPAPATPAKKSPAPADTTR